MDELWSLLTSQPVGLEATASTFLRFSADIRETVAALGVPTHAASRLAKYEAAAADLFRSKLTGKWVKNDTVRLGARAYLELWQLAAVAHYLHLQQGTADVRNKASLLLQDAALPPTDVTKPSPGRDTQFELFVAASWSACGYRCTVHEPPGPDFKVVLAGHNVGLEVKRIKSASSLGKRLQKANSQIALVPKGGLVVTDLSSVVLNDLPYLRAPTRTAAISDLELRLRKFMADRVELARKHVQPLTTFGWVGYCQAMYLLADGPPLLAYQWKNYNLAPGSDPRWLALVSMFQHLVAAPTVFVSSSP